MKDSLAENVRRRWKQTGQTCSHLTLSHEVSFSGQTTGTYVCTTCGVAFKLASESVNDVGIGKTITR